MKLAELHADLPKFAGVVEAKFAKLSRYTGWRAGVSEPFYYDNEGFMIEADAGAAATGVQTVRLYGVSQSNDWVRTYPEGTTVQQIVNDKDGVDHIIVVWDSVVTDRATGAVNTAPTEVSVLRVER